MSKTTIGKINFSNSNSFVHPIELKIFSDEYELLLKIKEESKNVLNQIHVNKIKGIEINEFEKLIGEYMGKYI